MVIARGRGTLLALFSSKLCLKKNLIITCNYPIHSIVQQIRQGAESKFPYSFYFNFQSIYWTVLKICMRPEDRAKPLQNWTPALPLPVGHYNIMCLSLGIFQVSLDTIIAIMFKFSQMFADPCSFRIPQHLSKTRTLLLTSLKVHFFLDCV